MSQGSEGIEELPVMTGYYDRQGNPMTRDEHFAAVLESVRENDVYGPPIRVGWDEFDGITVSTVWTGRDARGAAHYGKPAEIFESMAWTADSELERENYATEADAIEGHARIVAALRNGVHR